MQNQSNQGKGTEKNHESPSLNKEGSSLYQFKNRHSEAFRFAREGLDAERRGLLDDACSLYIKSGKLLISLAEDDKDDRLSPLLYNKGKELLQREKDLQSWINKNCNSGSAFERLVNWRRENRRRNFNEDGVEPFVPAPTSPASISVVDNLGGYSAPVSHSEDEEFTHMKYTPVTTVNPSYFSKDGYQLLCQERCRQIDVLIVVTMYNEDENELHMTLRKICKNVEYITRNNFPGFNGRDAWKKIAVCIVSDGRTKANSSTLKYAKKVGIFDAEVMTIQSLATDVELHLFEFSMQLLNAHKDEPTNMRFPPLQVIYALKEKNSGKLNSHAWFFNAFAEQIQPKYTVLLDVGTMPTESAIFRLLRSMERDRSIGGCCGEISVHNPNYLNFPVAAQQFEYKISNILDKSLESVFGYITVLPGAFSAYRYVAIQGAPLKAYFLSLSSTMKEIGAFKGNMYLAEDRILCFELIAKKNANWTLHYVKNAVARTDVPMSLVALIKQRRRWLNGSLFAALYAIFHFSRVWKSSGHSIMRKLLLTFQCIYLALNTLVSSLLISIFYLTFYFTVIVAFDEQSTRFFSEPDVINAFLALANVIYVLLILAQFVLGMGNRPDAVSHMYKISAFFWSILMGLTTTIAIAVFISASEFSTFYTYALITGIGIFFLASAIHGELHHILLTFIQYFSMLPTFVNILGIYSFCNLHDLSWGTKGLESSDNGHESGMRPVTTGRVIDVVEEQKRLQQEKEKANAAKQQLTDHFQRFRSYILLSWMSINGVFLTVCIQYWSPASFLKTLTILIIAFNTLRLLGSTLFIVARMIRSKHIMGPREVKDTQGLERVNSNDQEEIRYQNVASPVHV